MINGFSQGDIQAENCCLFAFFEVFPEYIPKPLSTKVENNSTSAVSTSNPGKKRRRWGRAGDQAPNVKGRGEGLD